MIRYLALQLGRDHWGWAVGDLETREVTRHLSFTSAHAVARKLNEGSDYERRCHSWETTKGWARDPFAAAA